MNVFQKGDRFIEKLSRTKHLFSITFIIAFLEASISPFLPEAFILIVLAYRKDISWKVLSLVSSLGSALGAFVMYIAGRLLYQSYGASILHMLHGESLANRAQELFEKNSFVAQFFAALTPLPDRVFSFLAGAFLISPFVIFIATFLGRLARVVPVAYLSYEYGDEARAYIKKHTRNTTVLIVVCVIVYVIYSYSK